MQKQTSRLEAYTPSGIQADILKDSDTESALATLLQIFESCLGPHGRCKLIHNGLGGHVTVTSSSTRLLQSLQLSNPVLTIVTASVKRHLTQFSDCGSMMTTLALNIIKTCLMLDVPRRLMTEIITLCAQECVNYLNSESCRCKVTVSLDNLENMLMLVRGIISTKPGCCMFSQDIEHINRCIIEVFLKSFNASDSQVEISEDNVQYNIIEGAPIRDSHVIEGMLLSANHIPTYRIKPLSTNLIQSGCYAGKIGVAIVNISMSGDSDNVLDVVFETPSKALLEDATKEQIMQFAMRLCNRGIGAVICQKVIHPRVKQLFHQQGVFVLDRLGLVNTRVLHRVAGGKLLSSFQMVIDEAYFGYVREISHKIINKKSFVHIIGIEETCCVYTMVLCGTSEESLSELKHLCTVGNHVLRQVMSTQRHALTGGGLWQHSLAMHLSQLPVGQIEEWCKSLDCSKFQIQTVLRVVSDSLIKIYSIVSGTSIIDCAVESNRHTDPHRACVVFDAFIPAVESVTTALFASSMILGIKNYISG